MYRYSGKDTIAAEQQAIEEARQLLEIAKAEHQAVLALRKERRRIERQINHYVTATNEAAAPAPEPLREPVYGGKAGLRAAAEEAKRVHDRNKAKKVAA
jgi:hypothetical protein